MVNPSKNDSKMEDTDDSFNVVAFCQRHLRVKSWTNERNQVYTAKELRQLIEIVVDIFKSEPTLKEVSPPCTIVGDIHGQYRDLVRILYQTTPEVEKRRSRGQDLGCSMNRFVFLGDYVDRGPNSVECICLLFSLKIIYPSQYTLLRGNHETKSINYVYGLREELMNKLDNDEGLDVWNRFNDAFALMPLAALVGTQILCMHGGISPHLQSLNDIRKIKRPLVDLRDGTLAQDLLWSDPLQFCNIHVMLDRPEYSPNVMRGLSVTFNEQAVKECCNKLGLQLIVRAHQMQNEGFKFFAQKKMLTIFSAPRYMLESNNLGAFLKVNEQGACSIVQMKAFTTEKIKSAQHDSTREVLKK